MGIQFPTSEVVVLCTECGQSWDAHLRLSRSRQTTAYHNDMDSWRDGDLPAEPPEIDFSVPPPAPTFRDCVQLLKEAHRGPMGYAGPMGPAGRDAPGAAT